MQKEQTCGIDQDSAQNCFVYSVVVWYGGYSTDYYEIYFYYNYYEPFFFFFR